MQEMTLCPACAGAARTIVCEYNRLLNRDGPVADASERSDYVLCHGCGLVYASLRPAPEELRRLWTRFDELLQHSPEADRPLRIHPLDSTKREELRRRLERGTFVSIESGPSDSDWLPPIQKDREDGSPHLDLLLSLLPDDGPRRALEIRSKTGFLLDRLRRHRGTDVHALPMFESEQLVIREGFGIPADSLLDEAAFEIPFDGEFDLIIAKHQLTHALAPDQMLAAIRARLAPGGQLYLFSEIDDSTELGRKGIFGFMVPFHLQAFDPGTLGRVLRAQGFEPTIVTRIGGKTGTLACLARLSPGIEPDSIAPSTLDGRLRYYQRWRDVSIVKLATKFDEDRLRELFGDDLDAVRERALSQGWAELRKGRVRVTRSEQADAAGVAA